MLHLNLTTSPLHVNFDTFNQDTLFLFESVIFSSPTRNKKLPSFSLISRYNKIIFVIVKQLSFKS